MKLLNKFNLRLCVVIILLNVFSQKLFSAETTNPLDTIRILSLDYQSKHHDLLPGDRVRLDYMGIRMKGYMNALTDSSIVLDRTELQIKYITRISPYDYELRKKQLSQKLLYFGIPAIFAGVFLAVVGFAFLSNPIIFLLGFLLGFAGSICYRIGVILFLYRIISMRYLSSRWNISIR